MKIMILNGPNLNFLGKRDILQYGSLSLVEINAMLENKANEFKAELLFFQSNHEGSLVDFIQLNSGICDGILINPGALTHYGYSLRDALADAALPVVEVHLSDVSTREDFRKTDVLDGIASSRISGLKEQSYILGLEKLIGLIK